MKRGKPLVRRTGLTSRTPLARSSPLARSTALTRTRMRVARAVVTREERNARKVVAARAGGLCEGCGDAGHTDWSHRIARSQGGPWCPSNGLALCRECHSFAHANPATARAYGWHLLSGTDPTTARAVLPLRGWVHLNVDGSITPTETRTA